MKQFDWQRALEAPTERFHEHVQSVLYALPEQEEMTMKKTWNLKRAGVLAAAVVMVLCIGVAAGDMMGYIRSDWRTTHDLKDPAAVVEALENEDVEGLTADAKFLEAYSNGFAFAGATLEGNEARADDDPTVYRYQTVDAWYERDGAVVYVDISPLIPGVSDVFAGAPVACGDVTLYALERNYKVVNEDYVPTAEEEDAVAAGELVFSYDDSLSAPELVRQGYVSWVQDGMRYSVNHMGGQVALEELTSMAVELVNS